MLSAYFKPTKVFAIVLSAFLFVPSCSVNPVTGKKEVVLMSEAQEISMGKSYDPQIVAMFGRYDDEKLQQFITEKGKEMAAISHRPHLNYEFKILDTPVLNAFAVPGGYVYFTRGILAHFNNEAEFAGVLGHEIGHITARHSVKQMSTQTLAQLGLVVGVIASDEFAKYAGLAQESLGLLFLKFGRDDESQSDQLGVEYSTKIGYDAHQMANFFNTLHRVSVESGAGQIPTFLSTHPDPIDREVKVNQEATKWQAGTPSSEFKVNRNEYLRRIDGLVYGDDPRQGYVADNKFFHPELKFEFPVPAGWKTQNSPAQFQMAPENGKAVMVLQLAEGQNIEEAATKFLSDNQLKVVERQSRKLNGLNVVSTIADQPAGVDANGNQTEALRAQTYFILYNNLIYQIMGLTRLVDYNIYKGYFDNTMNNFKILTDPNRLNVKPERIVIKTLNQTTTLRNALIGFQMPTDRLEELAVLNSMNLNDTVQAGTLIKVVGK